MTKSVDIFSIRIGSDDNSGIKVPLKVLISFTLKDVPIEQETKATVDKASTISLKKTCFLDL